MSETTIIKRGTIFTVDESFREIKDGSIVIEGNKIVAIGKSDEIARKYKGDNVIDAQGKAIMPGLVDLHYHSATFTRGTMCEVMLKGMPMEKLLVEFFYPFMEQITHKDVLAESSLAYVESIRTGTTCVNDIYVRIKSCADAAAKTGIRAVISGEALDIGPGERQEDNIKAFVEKNGIANGRVKIWFGVEWIPVCSPEFLIKTRELANKYKTGIHIHLNESLWEVNETVKAYKKRPTEHAYDLGVLGPDCVAAHCVHLTDNEIELFRKTGTHVSHNPISNMKLGNGFARVPDMLARGINVGLGMDAPQNNLDMFEVMKYGAYVHKGIRGDISIMPHDLMLKMATINGATALGMGKEIGSLEVGKKADIILIDLKNPKFEPILSGKLDNLLPNIINSGHGDDVETVIIDGKVVMENRKILTVDESQVMEEARVAAEALLAKIWK